MHGWSLQRDAYSNFRLVSGTDAAGCRCQHALLAGLDLAVFVSYLVSAQEFLATCIDTACPASGIISGLVRINAFGIAVPDVHVSAHQGDTTARIQIMDLDCQGQWDTFSGDDPCGCPTGTTSRLPGTAPL